MQMGLITGRNLQDPRFDLGKSLALEPSAHRLDDGRPSQQERPAIHVPAGRPERRKAVFHSHQAGVPRGRTRVSGRFPKMLAPPGKSSMLRPETGSIDFGPSRPIWGRAKTSGKRALRVIASSIRKGNVIEQDGKLYVVLSAENIHPGKGTPVSQIEMRRISDGVKVSERFKTTDQVEKATVEERNFNYLYEDSDGYHFMNPETYDQVQVSKDVVGNASAYLQENMTVKLSLHEMNPIAVQLPQRATLEVVDTEPVTKGQTASSSYKPAVLSNGLRTAVPPHITVGTRIVVMTEDGSYVERAKD